MIKGLLFSILLWSVAALGQTSRTPIVFECQCDDAVGMLYATSFRDTLAKSPRYVETSDLEQKDTSGKVIAENWHLIVLSLDPSKVGKESVMSVVLLAGKELFISQSIQYCPRQKFDECAQQTLSRLDSELH